MERTIAMPMRHNDHGPWQKYVEQVLFVKFPETQPGWTWQRVGAMFGLVGGVVSITFGSLLTAISWLVGTGASGWYVQRFGTVFLLATIPLLLFGAHCLDLLEKRARQEK